MRAIVMSVLVVAGFVSGTWAQGLPTTGARVRPHPEVVSVTTPAESAERPDAPRGPAIREQSCVHPLERASFR